MQQTMERETTQKQSAGLLFVNYELPRVMTRDELSKAIIYLVQIQRLATNNNINVMEFRK
jgi:hypothetical protein